MPRIKLLCCRFHQQAVGLYALRMIEKALFHYRRMELASEEFQGKALHPFFVSFCPCETAQQEPYRPQQDAAHGSTHHLAAFRVEQQ